MTLEAQGGCGVTITKFFNPLAISAAFFAFTAYQSLSFVVCITHWEVWMVRITSKHSIAVLGHFTVSRLQFLTMFKHVEGQIILKGRVAPWGAFLREDLEGTVYVNFAKIQEETKEAHLPSLGWDNIVIRGQIIT